MATNNDHPPSKDVLTDSAPSAQNPAKTPSGETVGRRDYVVLLLLCSVLLFASPFTNWWAKASFPWFFPYLLWGLLIALIALAQLFGADGDD